jgi:hypothetical protein
LRQAGPPAAVERQPERVEPLPLSTGPTF